MDFRYADGAFSMAFVHDEKEGYAGIELYRTDNGRVRVARVLYWDPSGQFFVETFGTDIPLALMERLVDEAKVRVRTKLQPKGLTGVTAFGENLPLMVRERRMSGWWLNSDSR